MVYTNHVIRTAWNTESAEDFEQLPFEQDFAEIRKILPVKNGFLVIGRRDEQSLRVATPTAQKMKAYIMDIAGSIKREIFLGRVYGDKCHITSTEHIAVGYFNQDIMEDTRMESVFCLWDLYGNPVWSDNANGIADCNAVHIGEKSIWYVVNNDSVIRLHEITHVAERFDAPLCNIVGLCCSMDETHFLFAEQKMKYGHPERYAFHTCLREENSFVNVMPLDDSYITLNIIKGFSFYRGRGIIWGTDSMKCFTLSAHDM